MYNQPDNDLLSFIWKPILKPLRINYSINDFFENSKIEDSLQYKIINFTFLNRFKEEINANIIINLSYDYLKFDNLSNNIIYNSKSNRNNNYTINNELQNTIIIYCHTHNSCCLEANYIKKYILNRNGILVCFDFRCHGKSGGYYSSIGFFEVHDIDYVILIVNFNIKYIF